MLDRLRSIAIATLLVALAGCGHDAKAPELNEVTDPRHGLSYELPDGWQRAAETLTPGLTDPLEEMSVGTFPLRYRESGCAHMPSSALQDMKPADAFITLEERGLDPTSSWMGFPPRPAHFGPEDGDASEASQCVDKPVFTDHWFGFSDGGRHFHVLVAFGKQAPAEVRDQAWGILDSLEVDPGVKPDWSSAG